MARYQVILAYDGTQFHGYQRQAGKLGERTVQQVVEAALQQLGWQGSSILSAGRTDRGVHAAGQVIAFDLDWRHTAQELQAALNAHLPLDVVATAARSARPDFHPRYDALARRYQYRLYCQAFRNPLRDRYTWRVWPAVDLERLQQAASALPGIHDFAAFGTPPRPGGSTIRDVSVATWQAEATCLMFEIVANAFLYHMVRRLVAAQVKIGQGELEPAAMDAYLEGGSQPLARGLAPPHGLTLVEVQYPPAVLEETPAWGLKGEPEKGEKFE